jgi:hypothetical protein
MSAFVMVPTVAFAHPLGNFTVNTYSGLHVGERRIAVDFVVDMAEIPAFQARSEIESSGTNVPSREAAYRSRECREITHKLDLRLDGRSLTLQVDSTSLAFPPGQAGLTTLRLTCSLSVATSSRHGDYTISYRSDNFTDRLGWREITAVGDGTTLVSSDVPPDSISGMLTSYPRDLLTSPLDRRMATLRVRPGGTTAPAGAPSPPPAPAIGTLYLRIRQLATAYVHAPMIPIFRGLTTLRDELFEFLNTPDPSQARDL